MTYRIPVVLAAVALGSAANVAWGQFATGVVAGTVRNAGIGAEVPYAGVLLPNARRETLADARGRFVLRDVSVGTALVRIRRVGFLPLDTTVRVARGETTFVRVALVPLSARLATVHVPGVSRVHLAAGCPAFRSENERMLIMTVLDQFVQNAEQYRSLVRLHPFWLRLTYVKITRKVDGGIASEPVKDPQLGTVSHLMLVGSDRAAYRVGGVFRKTRGVDEVFAPQLQDFADDAFLLTHCFATAGDTTIDATSYVRMTFAPVSTLTEPDMRGVVYLRADDYTLARVELTTTSVPPRFAKTYEAVRLQLRFEELLPGIVVLSRLESILTPSDEERLRFPTVASRGEVQDFVNVHWLKAPP